MVGHKGENLTTAKGKEEREEEMLRRGREKCEGKQERRIGIPRREREGNVSLQWDTGSFS